MAWLDDTDGDGVENSIRRLAFVRWLDLCYEGSASVHIFHVVNVATVAATAAYMWVATFHTTERIPPTSGNKKFQTCGKKSPDFPGQIFCIRIKETRNDHISCCSENTNYLQQDKSHEFLFSVLSLQSSSPTFSLPRLIPVSRISQIDWLEFNGTFSTVRLYSAFRSYSLCFGK